MRSTPLSNALRGVVAAPALADVPDDDLEPLLAAILADARRAWPTVALDDARYVEYLAARLPADAHRGSFAELHCDDLYLACGCAAQLPAALACFRDGIVADLDHAIVPAAGDRLEEVRQLVLEKLVVATEQSPPKITAYRGRGALHAWVRVSAARIALDLSRGRREERELADAALDAGPGLDPESAHLKASLRDELRRSIDVAAGRLSLRERNLLRQSLLDGLSIDELGALYGVHRATVARWLVSAREALARGTKGDLRTRLGLEGHDLDSVFRLVESQFDLSWSVLDGTEGEAHE